MGGGVNMIETVNQLLEELKKQGLSLIEPNLNIGHNPTIGRMYEGLTKTLMDQAIFSGLNLRVASGKISNSNGDFSRQIDCMIVIGEGKNIPFTEEYVYDVNDVIMVIEVKKKLFSGELSDAYGNLKSVIDIATPRDSMGVELLRDAFSGITKMELPNREDVNKLDFGTQMLYHALLVEAFLPIRVVLGYDGFASEYSLRDKFCEYLTKAQNGKEGAKGFGATSLPNLVIAGENSLIKTNGMPYAITTDTNEYCWIASYRCKPLLLLLELLWTRLTYKFAISSSIFGDNLKIENLAPLLLAKAHEHGWEYKVIPYSKAALEKMEEASEWNPTFVTNTEFILVNELCRHDVFIDAALENYVISKGENLEEIISRLMDERLITREGNTLKLLTKQCKCLIHPTYGFCVGEDCDGRFTKWIVNHSK